MNDIHAVSARLTRAKPIDSDSFVQPRI